MEVRICKYCGKEKKLIDDNFRLSYGRNKNKLYFRWKCRICETEIANNWRKANLSCAKEATKKFFIENPNYKRNWKNENRERIRKYTNEYESRPHVKLRKRLSRAINRSLKNGKDCSILSVLPYTIDELKQNIEFKFEPWMSWDNWGIYDPKTWDDNNPLTWTWQIDHKIPLANFNYKSMQDEAFQRAWALSNLRPYSAKQNIIDGACHNRIIKYKCSDDNNE